jgi:predicted pyridoxine 5'-phosphate oxidase superfamily flavin-nucleotide-binding protein
MGRQFAAISFTESVKAAQIHYGTRQANTGFERAEDPKNQLTALEQEFIAARDGFYQATVGENGWPYVQFRGGPTGFLKVIDNQTLGYADFRGNLQYISVGNLQADERISIILVDYPNRRRLKIWAKAKVVDEREYPQFIAQLEMPSYRAVVERGIILTVQAYDWNCPRHITPRYTEAEIDERFISPLKTRLAALELENRRLKGQPPSLDDINI